VHAASGVGLFDVEGVIVGDERIWTQASFRWLDEGDARSRPSVNDDPSSYSMILRPSIDRLTRSVLDAPPVTSPR